MIFFDSFMSENCTYLTIIQLILSNYFQKLKNFKNIDNIIVNKYQI